MEAKIRVEDSNNNGSVHVFNIETPSSGRNGDGEGEGQTKIEVQPQNGEAAAEEAAEGEIYPDKEGRTMFDRHYLNSGKPVPPYVGLRGKVSAVTWVELFAQQQLPAWRPVITPAQVVLTLVSMGMVMLAIGIGCTISTMRVVEVKENYSKLSPPNSLTAFTNEQKSRYLQENGGYTVQVDLKITEDMEPPIYVYYELTKFYQNNRRYVRSVSSQQIAGIATTTADLKQLCEPMLYVGGEPSEAYPKQGMINPCGLQAWSFFNDTFSFAKAPSLGAALESSTEGSTPIGVDSSNIAWPTDTTFLFGNVTAENFNIYPQYRGGDTVDLPLNQEQHFMVWMRMAAKPNFWKLWGVIDEKLSAGDVVRATILNQYNTYDFHGTKSIVLSTNSWLGNKNFFLGAMYIAVGGFFVIVGTLFQVAYWARPRGFGDHKHLSWNKP